MIWGDVDGQMVGFGGISIHIIVIGCLINVIYIMLKTSRS